MNSPFPILRFIINSTKIQYNKQYEIVLNRLKLEVELSNINDKFSRYVYITAEYFP